MEFTAWYKLVMWYIIMTLMTIIMVVVVVKGFIVSDFLVWGLPGFLTYLRFVYTFPNSLYSKFY